MSVKTNVEEMLVEKGIITRAQLERVKKVQFDHRDKSLTDIMLLLGYTTEAGILKCFSEKEADDVVCLDEKPADPAALAALPASFIRRNNVFPVCFAKGELVTAFTFPVDPHVLDEAEALSGMVIRPVLTSLDQMKTAIAGIGSTAEHENEDGKATEEKSESAPVIRLVNTLIESAYKRNASDIHIEPGKDYLTIRFRINGDLGLYTEMEMLYHRPVVTRLKLMGGMDIAEKRLPQDGKYRYESQEITTDLRISTLPSVYGETVVLRLLGNDRDSNLMDIRPSWNERNTGRDIRQNVKSPIWYHPGNRAYRKWEIYYSLCSIKPSGRQEDQPRYSRRPGGKGNPRSDAGTGQCKIRADICSSTPFYSPAGSGCDHGRRNER